MNNQVSATLEKRARSMFENSRRGAQLFVQWYSLTEDQRNTYRAEAQAIEDAMVRKLKEKSEG